MSLNLHFCRRQFVGSEPDGQSARSSRRFRFGGHGRAEPEQAIRRSSGPGPAVVAQFSGRFDHVAGCSSVVGQSAHVGRFAVGPTVDGQFGSAAASAAPFAALPLPERSVSGRTFVAPAEPIASHASRSAGSRCCVCAECRRTCGHEPQSAAERATGPGRPASALSSARLPESECGHTIGRGGGCFRRRKRRQQRRLRSRRWSRQPAVYICSSGDTHVVSGTGR